LDDIAGRLDRIPAVMLLNPSQKDHLPFQTMVSQSTTLSWLRDMLAEMQLGLDEVIVFDMFPILPDDLLEHVLQKLGPAKGRNWPRTRLRLRGQASN
jgi:hypothetical protein